jgi:hypothetical protein
LSLLALIISTQPLCSIARNEGEKRGEHVGKTYDASGLVTYCYDYKVERLEKHQHLPVTRYQSSPGVPLLAGVHSHAAPANQVVLYSLAVAIPMCFGVEMLRYRLNDFDISSIYMNTC